MKKTERCHKCLKRKRVNLFSEQSASKNNLHPWCKKCVRRYNKAYYQNHQADLLRKANVRYRLKRVEK